VRIRPADLARVGLVCGLHGLARTVDAALGVLLHTTLDVPGLPSHLLAAVDPAGAARAVALWAAGGLVAWLLLGRLRVGRDAPSFEAALQDEGRTFGPLLLRPLLTVTACASVALTPTVPYGFTLPVALTQDWGLAQDAAALAALAAGHLGLGRSVRVPAPSTRDFGFLAFLAYALLTPASARLWEGHPGNEPKTLRMAVALGHGLTLDVEGVSAPMEELVPRPAGEAVGGALHTFTRESVRLLSAVVHGRAGREAIRPDSRVTRQTVRGKEGGVFHVLAPGPSVLLAPALRVDRALNLRRGTPGRLAASVLLWNVLAGCLAAALYALLKEATGRAGLSAAVAALFALLPPFVFYSFQFYPEMLGALALTLALRSLVFAHFRTDAALWRLGAILAVLPWLHQKFLPVWGALTLWALGKAVSELVPLRALAGLLVPQLATLYATLLYNFAITGSARPDALFLAWGPGGVATARVGQGLLGLALDARYGILPYAPLYLLAGAGLVAGTRLRGALPAIGVYYLTVAAADNWSGAVCNLGRYVMPVLPWAAALVAVALTASAARRGVATLALALAGWSALLGVLLFQDPHAANDCALLLARSAYADGNVYVPNLFLRTWADAAPGLWARVSVWAVLAAVVAGWTCRAIRGRGADSPGRALAGLAAVCLVAGLVLERWPSPRGRPVYPDALELAPGETVFLGGAARVDGNGADVGSGVLDVLVRSRTPEDVLVLRFEGSGLVRPPGRAPLPVPASGLELPVPLDPVVRLEGRRGLTETLSRQRIELETERGLRVTVPAQPAILR
jgi:hypothetical protein